MRNKKLIIILSIVATLAVIIIVCAAMFIVRHVEAYNYYAEAKELDEAIIAASGIKTGGSMFFVDENEATEKIESAFYDVGVINIERKFPDRVSINYVVYKPSFMYLNGDRYYYCYSSGRIGDSSTAPEGGRFLVKPRDETQTNAGAYFQNENGYDRKLIDKFLDYLHTTGLNDEQIAGMISFVDLTKDGYFYIRTREGCSIEVRDTGEYFDALLDRAWSIFVDPDPAHNNINKSDGTIRAYMIKLDPQKPDYMTLYDKNSGEGYYKENYFKAA